MKTKLTLSMRETKAPNEEDKMNEFLSLSLSLLTKEAPNNNKPQKAFSLKL